MKKQRPVLIAKSFKDIKKGLHFKRIKDNAEATINAFKELSSTVDKLGISVGKYKAAVEEARRNRRPEYPSGQPFMEGRGTEIIQLNGDGSKEFITQTSGYVQQAGRLPMPVYFETTKQADGSDEIIRQVIR